MQNKKGWVKDLRASLFLGVFVAPCLLNRKVIQGSLPEKGDVVKDMLDWKSESCLGVG